MLFTRIHLKDAGFFRMIVNYSLVTSCRLVVIKSITVPRPFYFVIIFCCDSEAMVATKNDTPIISDKKVKVYDELVSGVKPTVTQHLYRNYLY